MVDREAGSDDEGATRSGEHQCGREEGRASEEDEDRENHTRARIADIPYQCCNDDQVKRNVIENFKILTVLEI